MSSATERTLRSSSTTKMVLVGVSVGDDAEWVNGIPFQGVFLALRFGATARPAGVAFFNGFRFGHSPAGGQLNLSRPGVYDRNAEEPWPHSVQRSPRLAAQASRSWSQAGASLQ